MFIFRIFSSADVNFQVLSFILEREKSPIFMVFVQFSLNFLIPPPSSKNKQGVYGSRSASLDRSLPLMPAPDFRYGGSGGPVQPNQPILQDPSMPLLPGPNTTTQLEEARRRLEDQQAAEKQKSR